MVGPLTIRQEQKLLSRISSGDDSAQEELLSGARYLIPRIVEPYVDDSKGLSRNELMEIGEEGLSKALDVYLSEGRDPERDYAFSTYATWWVRQAVHRALGIDE